MRIVLKPAFLSLLHHLTKQGSQSFANALAVLLLQAFDIPANIDP